MVFSPNEHLGPFHDSIAEAFEGATTGLLETNRCPPNEDVILIDSMAELETLPPAYDDQASPDALDWLDFLELRRSEYVTPPVPRLRENERQAAENAMSRVCGSLELELRAALAERGWHSQISGLAALLTIDCMLVRSVMGADSRFWERVLACLSGGVVPVGFTGRWPHGRLVAMRSPDVAAPKS